MEDLGIQVKAVLTVDPAESVENIDKNIENKVQGQIKSCKINLEVDDSKISDITKKINDIVASFNKIGNANVGNNIGEKVAKEQKTAQTAIQNTINLEKDWIKQRRTYDSGGALTSQSTTYKLNDYLNRTVNQNSGETNSIVEVENKLKALTIQEKEQLKVQADYLGRIKSEYSTIVSLKKKMSSSSVGENETSEMEHQVELAQRRISYDTKQLEKKKLLSNEVKSQINDYKKGVEIQDSYNNAKSKDKAVKETQKQIEFQNKLNISTEKYIQQLSSIQNKALDPNSTKAITNTTDISGVNTAYQEVITLVDKLGNSTTETFAKNETDVKNAISIMNQYISQLQNAEYAANQLRTKSVGEIKIEQISELNVLENSIKSAGIYTDELRGKISNLKTLLENIGDKESLTEYNIELSATVARFKELKSNANLQLKVENAEKSMQTLQSNIQSALNRLQTWKQENPKAMRSFGVAIDEADEKLKGLLSDLSAGNISQINKSFQGVNAQLREVKSNAVATGKAGKSLLDTFKEKAIKFAGWYGIVGVLMTVKNAITNMIGEVTTLDNSLLELSKVSDLTKDGLKDITAQAYELGKIVGKTGTQVIDAVTSFKRAGYNLQESTQLAENALKMTNVAEGIDDAGVAAENLVHILKGLGKQSDYSGTILDAINQVSNTQSVDFDDLVDGAERLSAVGTQAGLSFEQILGTLTGGYEVLGNMEKVSSGLITIFTRLQSIQLSDEEDVESVAKLQQTFSSATNGVVNIVDQSTGQLRNAYDILNDLNNIWDTLDKNTQEGLAFAAGGTRQKSVFLSIMQNWDNVKQSVESATDSVGSADEENQKYLDSISGRVNNLKSQLQSISTSLLESDDVKNILSILSGGLDIIDGYVSKFGALKGIIVPLIGTVLAFKGKSLLNTILESVNLVKDLGANIKSLKSLTSEFTFKDKFGTATGLGNGLGLSPEDLSALKEYKTLLNDGTTDAAKFSEVMAKMSPNAKAMAVDVESGAISIETLSSAEKAATISTKLLGTALKIATNVGILIAINLIVSGIQKLANAEEEGKNRIEENLSVAKEHEETLKSESEAIDDIISQYEKYKDITNLTSDDKKELSSIQDTLISKFGKEAENIDLVNGKYQEQYDLLRGIKVEKASQDYNASNTTLDNLKDSINSETQNSLLDYTSRDTKSEDAILAQILADTGHYKENIATYSTDFLAQVLAGSDTLTINDGSLSEQKKWIDDDLELLNEYRDTQKEIEINGKNIVLSDTQAFKDVYADLTKRQKLYTEYSTELQTKAQNAVKKFTLTINGATYDSSNVTSDIYKTWRENLLKQYENDKDGLSKEIVDYLDQTYDDAEYKFQLMSESDKIWYMQNQSKLSNDNQSFSDWLTDNTEALDEVQDKATSLSKTLQSLTDGSITDTDLVDLFQDYPDLAQYAGDTKKLKEELERLLKQNPQDMITDLENLRDALPNGSDKQAVESLITSLKKLGSVSSEIEVIDVTASDYITLEEDNIQKIIDKLNNENDAEQEIVDSLDEQKQTLEDIISDYDTAISSVTNYLNKQSDELENKKTKIEDAYNTEIDKIKSVNEEKQTSIDLQEKLDNLLNARKKKVSVYSEETGWQFETDTQSVKTANQEYQNALNDKKVSDIESERDKETANIDKQIEAIKTYSDEWSNITSNITQSDNDLIASKILGSGWQSKLDEKNVGLMTKFASSYTSYNNKLKNQVEVEISNHQKIIDNRKDEIDSWSSYKNEIKSFYDDLTNKNKTYLENLKKFTLNEKSALQERAENMRANKKIITELSTGLYNNDSLKNALKGSNLYTLEQNGEIVGTYESKAQADKAQTEMVGTLMSEEISGKKMTSDAIRFLSDAIKKSLKIKKYAQGGIGDYTGLSWLDGSKSSSETIFNANDSKKLYDFVHNSDNLTSAFLEKLKSNSTSLNNTYHLVFGDIITNNPQDFVNQLGNVLRQSNLERMIGK